MKITYIEVCTDLANTDEVYAKISKEDTKKLYESAGETPINQNGAEDHSYIEGEVQFIFEKDQTLSEILLFPVYEEDDGFINGDFIPGPEGLWAKEDEARKILISVLEES